MKAVVSSTLFVLVTLAGCTSDPDGSVPGTGIDGGVDDEPFQLDLPEWQVGDWWTYGNSYGNDFTLVVSEDGGTTWTMDTDQANLAFVHSLTEISFLGDIRKSDLAGSQGSDDVQWLDFPLQNNKEWSTTWDGQDFDLISHVDEATQVAHITASIDDTIVNQVVYDADVGWFTKMVFGDPETGEETGDLELKDSGSGFTGELVRVDPQVIDEKTYTGAQSQSFATYDAIDADDADAYLILDAVCETGQFVFAIGTVQALAETTAATGTFEDQGHTVQSACPATYGFNGVIGLDPGNGDQWGHLITSESPDLELTFTLYVRHFERIVL